MLQEAATYIPYEIPQLRRESPQGRRSFLALMEYVTQRL